MPSSASPSFPWATEPLVSLKPVLHHLTVSGVSAKERWQNDSPSGASGHYSGLPFPHLKLPPKTATCDRMPSRPCAENHGGVGNYTVGPMWG